MNKISTPIPSYNEEENVVPLCNGFVKILEDELSDYDYEVVFIDSNSTAKVWLRFTTILGVIVGGLTFLISIVYINNGA